MATQKTYTVKKLIKILRQYDARFYLDKKGGKGSHRRLCHPDINGREVIYTIPCPRGEKTEVAKHYIAKIIKIFHLPKNLL